MAYQMTITLTDQEYAALSAEAAKIGKQPEALLRDMVQRLQSSSSVKHPMTGREFMEKLYREGKVLNIPTWKPLTEEEKAERAQLSQALAGGKPLSEIVIEGRGPY